MCLNKMVKKPKPNELFECLTILRDWHLKGLCSVFEVQYFIALSIQNTEKNQEFENVKQHIIIKGK